MTDVWGYIGDLILIRLWVPWQRGAKSFRQTILDVVDRQPHGFTVNDTPQSLLIDFRNNEPVLAVYHPLNVRQVQLIKADLCLVAGSGQSRVRDWTHPQA